MLMALRRQFSQYGFSPILCMKLLGNMISISCMGRFIYLLVSLLLLSTVNANSQQWIAKQYGYDSIPDIQYGITTNYAGIGDSLEMDVFIPSCNDSTLVPRWPLIVFIHGGAFLSGSKNDASIQDLCRQFAKRGYVTASISYRLGFVSDDNAWSCNYPSYNCVFAADSAEWIRAYYRGVQDAKGAIRYLVNRHQQLQIDTSNVFVAGESAGGFLAMGAAFMDVNSERPLETFAASGIPAPNANASNCPYASPIPWPATVSRGDLGGISGTIEPVSAPFTIKAVGNIYGGMFSNLLAAHDNSKPKPALYLFHQPCDLVVPIDSGGLYSGLSWCFTNGYNCSAIANTPKAYGSRAISNWNSNFGYGYNMQPEFTTVNFPYNYLFGQASCIDQANTPCHAYDSKAARELNMAQFFAGLVTTNLTCSNISGIYETDNNLLINPNPVMHELSIGGELGFNYEVLDLQGRKHIFGLKKQGEGITLDARSLIQGAYLFRAIFEDGTIRSKIIIKL